VLPTLYVGEPGAASGFTFFAVACGPTCPYQTVMTMTIPAVGQFLVTGKIQVWGASNGTSGSNGALVCVLWNNTMGSPPQPTSFPSAQNTFNGLNFTWVAGSVDYAVLTPSIGWTSLSLQGYVNFGSAGGTVTLQCTGNAVGPNTLAVYTNPMSLEAHA